MNLIKINEIESTNQYLKAYINDFHHFDVLLAAQQTKGKGRQNNQWYSDNDSLTFSILLKEINDQSLISMLPLLMAKIVHQSINALVKDVEIKWPNDILIQSKKVSGILIESIIQGKQTHVIIGVGINVNQSTFPSSIKDKAISIKHVLSQQVSKMKILNQMLQRFENELVSIKDRTEQIIDYCNQYLAYKNQMISYKDKDGQHFGRCVSINDQGHLILDENGEVKTLISGEIHQISTLS